MKAKAPPSPTGASLLSLTRAAIEEFPDAGSMTIAKILVKRHPTAFPDLHNARQRVCYARGLHGKQNRKASARAIGALQKKPGWQTDAQPRSLSKKRTPFVISGPAKIAVFGDVHIPYHDMAAVELMVDHLKKKLKPDILLINGDLCDFYSCSRHEKDPRRPLAQELDATRQFLYWLRKKFPTQRILYKQGNHETNVERYLIRAAPVLLGVSDFELPVLLKFDELRIEHVAPLQLIRAGKLPIYHGHELPQGMTSPVNPARGVWMRVQESLMCNHWHRTSSHTETTGLSKKVHTCWSNGCLCDLSPDYALINKWDHGFTELILLNSSGDFEVTQRKIIQGKVY